MMRTVRRALPWLALSNRFLEPSLSLRSVRQHSPICGPPRFPMSGAQKLLIGGGSLLLMMIIPFWALFSMPRWSALHRGVPWYELDRPEEKAENVEKLENVENVEKEEEKKEIGDKK